MSAARDACLAALKSKPCHERAWWNRMPAESRRVVLVMAGVSHAMTGFAWDELGEGEKAALSSVHDRLFTQYQRLRGMFLMREYGVAGGAA